MSTNYLTPPTFPLPPPPSTSLPSLPPTSLPSLPPTSLPTLPPTVRPSSSAPTPASAPTSAPACTIKHLEPHILCRKLSSVYHPPWHGEEATPRLPLRCHLGEDKNLSSVRTVWHVALLKLTASPPAACGLACSENACHVCVCMCACMRVCIFDWVLSLPSPGKLLHLLLVVVVMVEACFPPPCLQVDWRPRFLSFPVLKY